jgi:deaminated glutathione amidase
VKRPLVVAAVQLQSQAEVGENLDRVESRVAEAAGRGAEVVVLPENFAFFGEEEGKRAVAEEFSPGSAATGVIRARLSEMARKHAVHVVAGGVPERSSDPDRPFNACVVVSREGAIHAVYRKVHLFDVDLVDGTRYRESGSTSAGSEPVTVDIEGTNFGLSVCYDLRFPELYRALAGAGAEVLVVPAAFTLLTGKDHWHVLLRARAIESQAYVIAAAQGGKHPRGRQTYGKSCIIDPWGDVIAQASEGEGVVVATLDPAYLERVRANLPALRHRRL